MAIPDYQTLMLPLLKYLEDGKPQTLSNVHDALSNEFGLTAEERNELLSSGKQGVMRNRVGWARTYLKKAGLINTLERGVFQITDRGRKVLAESPGRIDNKYLNRFPEFIAFLNGYRREDDLNFKEGRESTRGRTGTTAETANLETPEEQVNSAYESLRKSLASEVLELVKQSSPQFFERLVVDLLLKMGYGGSRAEAGQATQLTADGGIDGIINEDRLGLDRIYLQAKRWGDTTVGRPEIQKFAGALQGVRAKKGVFITTSKFTQEAREFAKNLESKIVLLDGNQLSEYMIDFNVGVSLKEAYEIKQIDSDYFSEE